MFFLYQISPTFASFGSNIIFNPELVIVASRVKTTAFKRMGAQNSVPKNIKKKNLALFHEVGDKSNKN